MMDLTQTVQCPHCKVRYNKDRALCPVCKKAQDAAVGCGASFDEAALARAPKWKPAFLITSFILMFIPGLVSLFTDRMITGTLTWSPLVLAIVFFSWVYVAVFVMLYSARFLFFAGFTAATVLFLFVLNWVLQGRWFMTLAFPLSLVWIAAVFVSSEWIFRLKRKSLNVAGVLFLLIALAVVATELLLHYSSRIPVQQDALPLSWSLIVFAAMMPLSAVMFYLNAHRSAALGRWLHL